MERPRVNVPERTGEVISERGPAQRDGPYDDQRSRGPSLAAMTEAERATFAEAYDATRLALEVGDKVRDAREAAGLSQRELAARMGTSRRPWPVSRPAGSARR